jgi:hypothetical protein
MARMPRSAWRHAASALLLTAALTPQVAAAQSPTLEAVYVVLGPQGAVARAVVAGATSCPAITIDGTQQPMNVRAPPDAMFPVLVCEMPIPAGAKSASIVSASIENSPLPLPRAELKSIVAFGDTGCRLKAATSLRTPEISMACERCPHHVQRVANIKAAGALAGGPLP